jgi:hypothetical protein
MSSNNVNTNVMQKVKLDVRPPPSLSERFGKLFDDRLFLASLLVGWMLVTLLGYLYLGVYHSSYFTFGPNANLHFVGAPIDTWSKWGCLLAARVLSAITEAALGDLIEPWIITNLQDADKIYLPYRKWKCRMVVHFFYFYHELDIVFNLFLSLMQFDIALAVIVCKSFVLQFWTLPRWLANKHFVARDDTIEKLFVNKN